MNRQRKVLITTTYNEMGIIIDTKAEEVAQQNLQQTCNKLATDCISRHAVSAWLDNIGHPEFADVVMDENRFPSAQPERKKGEWVNARDGYDGHVKCNKCFKTYDWTSDAQYFNFCPNCGSYNGGKNEV